MPRRRESVGRALRRALGEEVVLPKIEPRQPGVSHLMNSRRLRIFQAVFNEPGLHLRELQRKLDVPLQSLRWHVAVLVRSGILEKVAAGKKGLIFSPLSAGREGMISEALRRDPRYGEILKILSERGTASVKELMRETGAYQQLVSARLKTLKARGTVESGGKGPRTRYRMTASAQVASTPHSADSKERLLSLLRDQGLVPKISRQSGDRLVLKVSDGSVETELSFLI